MVQRRAQDFGCSNSPSCAPLQQNEVQKMMSAFLRVAALCAGLLAVPVWAQSPPSVRVVGAVEEFDGATLTVKEKDGDEKAVKLAENATIYGVEKRAISDIKPGDFVASGGVKGTDGKIHAVEMRI